MYQGSLCQFSVTTKEGRLVPAVATRRHTLYVYVVLRDGSVAKVLRPMLWLAPGWTLKALEYRPKSIKLLSVTVMPQSNCNARCGYCFNNEAVGEDGTVQRIPNGGMHDGVIRATAKFIGNVLKRKRLRGVDLTLLGGEPLLNPERCYKLLDQIPGVKVARLITNGTHLTTEVAEELTKRGVGPLQVTFDGRREDHDRIRPLAHGGGTYDMIIANLRRLDARPELLVHRSLRVNVSADNIGGLGELIRDLAYQLRPELYTLYFTLVSDNGIGWQGGLGEKEAQVQIDQLITKAASLGFQPMPGATGTTDCGFCTGEFGEGGMVIGPDGHLYSCWDTMGHPGMEVGNVWGGYVKPAGHKDRWLHCGDQSRNAPRRKEPVSAPDIAPSTWLYLEYHVRHLK